MLKVKLDKAIGFPLILDREKLTLRFGSGVDSGEHWEKGLGGNKSSGDALWKSLAFSTNYVNFRGEVILDPPFSQLWKYHPEPLYFGHRGVHFSGGCMEEVLYDAHLRYDVTVLRPGFVGSELIRTEGHGHRRNTPEIYETVYGRNLFLLFKESRETNDIEDFLIVEAEAGDHTIFPNGYHHISINLDAEHTGECFVMTNWVSTNAEPDFRFIKERHGGPYWVFRDGETGYRMVPNSHRYGKIPPARIVRPAESIPELGLKKGEPMIGLVRKGREFENLEIFLNSPRYDENRRIYEKAFVDVER